VTENGRIENETIILMRLKNPFKNILTILLYQLKANMNFLFLDIQDVYKIRQRKRINFLQKLWGLENTHNDINFS